MKSTLLTNMSCILFEEVQTCIFLLYFYCTDKVLHIHCIEPKQDTYCYFLFVPNFFQIFVTHIASTVSFPSPFCSFLFALSRSP